MRKLGVNVVEINTLELMKGGVNGLSRMTLALARDPGLNKPDFQKSK